MKRSATAVLFFYGSAIALAQITEFKILPSDGEMGAEFGNSVSVFNGYAIVGAYFDDNENGLDAGSAYIFERIDTSWVEIQKLFASDGSALETFGSSVSIYEDYAVVGSPFADGNFNNTGAVYLYKNDSTGWNEKLKLIPSDATEGIDFGWSVSIAGEFIIVGAWGDNVNGLYSGSAYIYRRNDTTWIEDQKLIASDGDSLDNFGIAVSISGDYAIIGAPHDDDNGENSGSAYIYKRQDTTWIEVQKLLPTDGAAGDEFGWSVSIYGEDAIVGSNQSDAAYIFGYNGIDWIEEQKLTSDNSPLVFSFGGSVSIYEDYAAVGASGENNLGSTYIFRKETNNWVQEQKLVASDSGENDFFGISVSIADNITLIGASFNDDNGENSGSAYIYNGFVLDVEDEKYLKVPDNYRLFQNYPNPFNPSTKISWQVPAGSWQTLKIYDVLGNEVATLVDEYKPAGTYEVEFNISSISGNVSAKGGYASGVYFYQLRTDGFIETKKMILLK